MCAHIQKLVQLCTVEHSPKFMAKNCAGCSSCAKFWAKRISTAVIYCTGNILRWMLKLSKFDAYTAQKLAQLGGKTALVCLPCSRFLLLWYWPWRTLSTLQCVWEEYCYNFTLWETTRLIREEEGIFFLLEFFWSTFSSFPSVAQGCLISMLQTNIIFLG